MLGDWLTMERVYELIAGKGPMDRWRRRRWMKELEAAQARLEARARKEEMSKRVKDRGKTVFGHDPNASKPNDACLPRFPSTTPGITVIEERIAAEKRSRYDLVGAHLLDENGNKKKEEPRQEPYVRPQEDTSHLRGYGRYTLPVDAPVEHARELLDKSIEKCKWYWIAPKVKAVIGDHPLVVAYPELGPYLESKCRTNAYTNLGTIYKEPYVRKNAKGYTRWTQEGFPPDAPPKSANSPKGQPTPPTSESEGSWGSLTTISGGTVSDEDVETASIHIRWAPSVDEHKARESGDATAGAEGTIASSSAVAGDDPGSTHPKTPRPATPPPSKPFDSGYQSGISAEAQRIKSATPDLGPIPSTTAAMIAAQLAEASQDSIIAGHTGAIPFEATNKPHMHKTVPSDRIITFDENGDNDDAVASYSDDEGRMLDGPERDPCTRSSTPPFKSTLQKPMSDSEVMGLTFSGLGTDATSSEQAKTAHVADETVSSSSSRPVAPTPSNRPAEPKRLTREEALALFQGLKTPTGPLHSQYKVKNDAKITGITDYDGSPTPRIVPHPAAAIQANGKYQYVSPSVEDEDDHDDSIPDDIMLESA